MHPALEAANAKFDRALEHAETLNFEIDDFLAGNPYRVAVHFEAKTGWHVATFQIDEYPPPLLSILVGEIAHSCISALNHLVWELAARKQGRRRVLAMKRSVLFPVATSPGDFVSHAIVHKRLVSAKALAIIERLQPYNAGGSEASAHPLAIMKDIADLDKHRILTSSFARIDFDELVWEWDRTATGGFGTESMWPPGVAKRRPRLENGTPLARIRFGTGNAKAKVHVDRRPAAEIHFGATRWHFPASYFRNGLVVIHEALEAFEPLFPG